MSLENMNEPMMNARIDVPDLLHRQGCEYGWPDTPNPTYIVLPIEFIRQPSLTEGSRIISEVTDHSPVCMLTKHDHTLNTAESSRPVAKQPIMSTASPHDTVTSSRR